MVQKNIYKSSILLFIYFRIYFFFCRKKAAFKFIYTGYNNNNKWYVFSHGTRINVGSRVGTCVYADADDERGPASDIEIGREKRIEGTNRSRESGCAHVFVYTLFRQSKRNITSKRGELFRVVRVAPVKSDLARIQIYTGFN